MRADMAFPEERGLPVAFASTHWSVVLRAGNGDAPEAEAALGKLYLTYASPLYAYVRRQGHPPETAKELVQELFLALLSKNQLAMVSPAKGRFRSYLLACANHLLANEWHKQRRLKRGGAQPLVALDELTEEARYRLEPADVRTPQEVYERRWALALLDGVFARLSEEWRQGGKEQMFDVLKVYLSGDQDAPGYAAAGTSMGLNEGAVRVAVHRLRQRFRDLLYAEIAQTVANPEDVADEWQHLIRVLRR